MEQKTAEISKTFYILLKRSWYIHDKSSTTTTNHLDNNQQLVFKMKTDTTFLIFTFNTPANGNKHHSHRTWWATLARLGKIWPDLVSFGVQWPKKNLLGNQSFWNFIYHYKNLQICQLFDNIYCRDKIKLILLVLLNNIFTVPRDKLHIRIFLYCRHSLI